MRNESKKKHHSLCPSGGFAHNSFLKETALTEFKIAWKWKNCFQFLCTPSSLLTTDSLLCAGWVFWGLLLQPTLPSWSFLRDSAEALACIKGYMTGQYWMTAAFIPISEFLKMCLGFPCKIPVHALIGFDFEGYAKKKVFTTDGCLTLKGLGTLSFGAFFCNLMLFQ